MIQIKGIKKLGKSELVETKGAYCADYMYNLNFVCNYFSFLSAPARMAAAEAEQYLIHWENLQSS